jgi:hyperosmotically inducible protein
VAAAHADVQASSFNPQKEIEMKTLLLSSLVAVSALTGAAFADEPNNGSDTEQAGSYVKDSVITTKVKSKLAAKHMSTLTNIKVDTDEQGVVWLSGKAPSKDASDLATMIAKDTDGVTAVHNHIVIDQQ